MWVTRVLLTSLRRERVLTAEGYSSETPMIGTPLFLETMEDVLSY